MNSGWTTLQGRVFPGGCFFYEVIASWTPGGPVHDAVAEAQRDWAAHGLASPRPGTWVSCAPTRMQQLAFELIALMETANAVSVLRDKTTCTGGTTSPSSAAARGGDRPVPRARALLACRALPTRRALLEHASL